ncbi:cobalt ECF transporter T component CbiQ [Blastococcus sp. Marseille-P5729]|uniref:cobalt ECF transporter T component CbiQ n=1 Tax=Blastococcus sp. Marseille-P5729 TaxID=2086582 RepID=UPI000D0FCE03|nr:cobalt ECF transporter T component CbiQ [Blastococcus sp. Marseille-P5729]
MSAGHAHAGYVPGGSWLHQAHAHHKVLASLILVISVVAVPAGVWWPYAVALGILLAAAATARLRALSVARRMLIEIPFVLFALALPFFARGPRIEVLGIAVSEPGLIAAGAMLCKATLGVLAGIVLASTTEPAEMIAGLRRLRLPSLLVQIASFMLRYLSVITDDLRRMRIARESRCYAGGGLGHARAVASSAGALFVRSYERGERVHLAMLSRGYTGEMPALGSRALTAAPLALVAGVAVVVAATTAAWMIR